MSRTSDAFRTRARESLAGAASELQQGRYNNCANRSYSACFQAAIAALDEADVKPSGKGGKWRHDWVQAQFGGTLVNRRKRFPSELSPFFNDVRKVREQADYQAIPVAEVLANRTFSRARRFVEALTA